MRNVRRGLERDRYVKKRCLKEFMGAAEDMVESCDEASSGMAYSSEPSAACFLLLLRCGNDVSLMLCATSCRNTSGDAGFVLSPAVATIPATRGRSVGLHSHLALGPLLLSHTSLARKYFFLSIFCWLAECGECVAACRSEQLAASDSLRMHGAQRNALPRAVRRFERTRRTGMLH